VNGGSRPAGHDDRCGGAPCQCRRRSSGGSKNASSNHLLPYSLSGSSFIAFLLDNRYDKQQQHADN